MINKPGGTRKAETTKIGQDEPLASVAISGDVDMKPVQCGVCKGTGWFAGSTCEACKGHGLVYLPTWMTVRAKS